MQKYFEDSNESSIGWPFPRSQPLSGLTGLGHLMTILQRLGDGLAYVVGSNLFALVLFWSKGSVDVAAGLALAFSAWTQVLVCGGRMFPFSSDDKLPPLKTAVLRALTHPSASRKGPPAS